MSHGRPEHLLVPGHGRVEIAHGDADVIDLGERAAGRFLVGVVVSESHLPDNLPARSRSRVGRYCAAPP